MAQELREVFDLLDLDKSGFLTVTEVHEALKQLGGTAEPGEVEADFQKYDVNGDGKLSFEEFSNMVNKA